MQATTIKIHQETKQKLNSFREHSRETYDQVIAKLVYIAQLSENSPKLSQETIKGIKAARKRVQEGKFVSEDEVKKRFGI